MFLITDSGLKAIGGSFIMMSNDKLDNSDVRILNWLANESTKDHTLDFDKISNFDVHIKRLIRKGFVIEE